MRRTGLISAVCCLLISMASCVHEYPYDEPEVEETLYNTAVKVDFTFDTDSMPLYQTKTVTRSGSASYDVRYIVEAYKYSGTTYSSTAYTRTSTTASSLQSDYAKTLSMTLPAGKYRLMGWVDYVPYGTTADYCWNTDLLREVTIMDDYVGHEEYKDCCCGNIDFEVTGEGSGTTVWMTRNVGKLTIVSNDFSDFLEKFDLTESSCDLSAYTIKVWFTGYLPSSYNTASGQIIDATTGVSYTGSLSRYDEENVFLTTDFTFAYESTETTVTMSMAIYDPDGDLLSTVSSLSVPMVRGKETLVVGNFLTKSSGGGIGVSPEFSGEFNIQIR